MHISELDFTYPERLIATEPAHPSRIMLVNSDSKPTELKSKADLLHLFAPGDVLVVNDTKVLKRRVFTESGLEILFLQSQSENKIWDVLCPSSRWRDGEVQKLPADIEARIVQRGRLQKIELSRAIDESYFLANGEMPLPPYIQKARAERHNRATDANVYQTAWAERDGSLAAPTASLHFTSEDLEALRTRGVHVEKLTLHVGLGTFLPVTAENLEQHVMHAEFAEISAPTWKNLSDAKNTGGKVWALGTTVTRALESAAHGQLELTDNGGFFGQTDLFIRPGFEFRMVDRLLTNFHQPRSTLLALVGTFAGLDVVKSAYAWAIEREFRLFSYGDLSVWTRK